MRALPSFRLIDGVVIAAIALLGLKVLGFATDVGPPAPAGLEPRTAAAPAKVGSFGRVLSHARTNYEPPADPTTTGSLKSEEGGAPKGEGPPLRPPAPPMNPPSASERALLERLGERRDELHQRSREMEARERMLQEQERKLDDRLNQAKAADEAQKIPAAAKPGADPSGLRNVVIMYEAMKPKEAARVFDRLPLEVLLSVVTQMNARKMSEVLAMMAPENAEKLTVALARRAAGQDEAKPGPVAGSLPAGELPAIERPAQPRR